MWFMFQTSPSADLQWQISPIEIKTMSAPSSLHGEHPAGAKGLHVDPTVL